MSKVISAKSTADALNAILGVLQDGDHPVIQTDCPELVQELLLAVNRGYSTGIDWNEKNTLAEGLKALRLSLQWKASDAMIPVFLKKHPVGILPAPFVKIQIEQLYCKIDGLASELIAQDRREIDLSDEPKVETSTLN